ncbi:MAG: hypothetical protein HOM69_13805 [Gammaproteobacteria bacterium]|jgi:hypothetical protein|nr:hypothetical protein [Gammaproteobacteria bacterium]MBT5054294.1 hypothetical protein [Gammaproteobacteria bacterium]
MRLESIIQSIQGIRSGKLVQHSARLLGAFVLMLVSLNGFAAADDSADADTIISPCDPFMDPTCIGKVELRDGRQFEGRLVAGQPAGQGVMTFPDGGRFEGYFESGMQMGRGTYYLSDGGSYTGFWVRDRLNGPVKLRDRDGNLYEGPVVNHRAAGRGNMMFSNGDRYVGEFAFGLAHGRGVMVYGASRASNVGDRFEGQFQQGRRQGSARYYWADGAVWEVSCQMDRCERSGLISALIHDKARSREAAPSERPRRLR